MSKEAAKGKASQNSNNQPRSQGQASSAKPPDPTSENNSNENLNLIYKRYPQDVLCGRGLPIQNHFGNLRMHSIIDSYRQTYTRSIKCHKKVIIKQIIQEIKEDGARFLKKYRGPGYEKKFGKGCWIEMDDHYAHEKVSHALRCKHRKNEAEDIRSIPLPAKVPIDDKGTEGNTSDKSEESAVVPDSPTLDLPTPNLPTSSGNASSSRDGVAAGSDTDGSTSEESDDSEVVPDGPISSGNASSMRKECEEASSDSDEESTSDESEESEVVPEGPVSSGNTSSMRDESEVYPDVVASLPRYG